MQIIFACLWSMQHKYKYYLHFCCKMQHTCKSCTCTHSHVHKIISSFSYLFALERTACEDFRSTSRNCNCEHHETIFNSNITTALLTYTVHAQNNKLKSIAAHQFKMNSEAIVVSEFSGSIASRVPRDTGLHQPFALVHEVLASIAPSEPRI